MKAKDKLYELYSEVKAEGNCSEYVEEMCAQLRLFGTETNTLTRQNIYNKMEGVLKDIKKSLDTSN